MKELVKIKINPKDINFFNRIMEGYEYLGIVSTLNKKDGIVVVRTTPDTYDEVREIVNHLQLEYIEYIDV
ncbi:DUF4911 domain-containing protein [Anaerosinus massiliensis]|uniref:DUF4911 domain-containing protein n=1 Tax=Massilibacillus massiliensis TaxID=1806837 RepID=UPI000A821E17|nr:DUF4911 domain-containing protein [Massilibacillus massiliensis]